VLKDVWLEPSPPKNNTVVVRDETGLYRVMRDGEELDNTFYGHEAYALADEYNRSGSMGPKFPSFVEPGGSNYREMFVTAPG